MSSTPTIDATFDSVCDALRDVHDEASLWRLSDEIARVAPSGVNAVEAIVAQAKARGIPTKSTNTLRLYRDVAIRFPASERIPLVSFSAHRAAIAVGDVAKARAVLLDLVNKHGADGVTVTTVKQAIGAATGNVKKSLPKGTVTQSTWSDVALDLVGGGKSLIKELDAMCEVKGVTLDGLHSGLTAVLAAVESKRSKAARKAAASKAKAAPVVNPAKSPAAASARRAAAKVAPTGKPAVKRASKAGDLRGL
jgi:hypothetical protein